MIPKAELRVFWKARRQSISEDRRKRAEQDLFAYVEQTIEAKNVLSFSSFGSEISTKLVNEQLSQIGELLLSRVEGPELEVYRVHNLASDLILSPLGFMEPDPNRCEKVDPEMIQTVFVPGLAFNESFHRLGYGKGHYDRLLKRLKCRFLGLAFLEQKTNALAPDPWDVPLHTVTYF